MACFLSMAQQGLKQWEKASPIGCDDFAQPQIENRLGKVETAPVQHKPQRLAMMSMNSRKPVHHKEANLTTHRFLLWG